MASVHVCWHKLIGISLVWTYFKKEHCKCLVFTKGLSYILRNCYCNKHVTKSISQLHEDWDLWCRCSVCPPLTCSLYPNVLKCSPWTSTTRRLCTRKFYVANPSICQYFLRFSIFHFSIYDTSITLMCTWSVLRPTNMFIVIIIQCWKIIILEATSLNSLPSTNAMLFRELRNWLDWTLPAPVARVVQFLIFA